VIQCCFGEDRGAAVIRQWFASLSPAEQAARRQFTSQFKPHYDAFRALPLGTERHKTEHRIGYPGVTVTIIGYFGAIYVGNPVQSVPTSETRIFDAGDDAGLLAIQANQRPLAVRPRWQDFTIDNKPLFGEFQSYLQQAEQVVATARAISQSVHGSQPLTVPP
jgi:hypothetical protein